MADWVLLDTGFLVALLNDRDPAHDECVAISKKVRARIATVEGVLVEAFFVMRGDANALDHAVELLKRWNVVIMPSSLAVFESVATLVRRYSRMDVVDGLLVAAAESLKTRKILTLDRRDFSVYRLRGNRAFEIIE